VTCHDPHKKSEFSIHTACADCHTDIAAVYAGTKMDLVGVTCVECHMPFASKSAVASSPDKGDVRTHLFRINTALDVQMFTPDGAFVQLDGDGQGAVNVNFACRSCHTDKVGPKGNKWLAKKAMDFHMKVGGGKKPKQ
jgi:hypothetical protein